MNSDRARGGGSARWQLLFRVGFALALIGHLVLGVAPAWRGVERRQHASDFASYYYAVRAAEEGLNPYERSNLEHIARAEDTRRRVYPFFYPPPFLLAVLWSAPFDLHTAFEVWFWINEGLLIIALFALWRWWRPLGPAVPAVLAVVAALASPIPANLVIGQANLAVFALAVLGMALAHPLSGQRPSRAAEIAGGALVGAACMLKMSPAFFVAWWLLRRRWLAVAGSAAAALLLSAATLPVLPAAMQLHFYTDVLPGFSAGRYPGLDLPIDLFGNHSLPNLFHEILGGGAALSAVGRSLARVSLLAFAAGLAWAFRKEPADALAAAGQFAAVAAAMLLAPVFTYEHHTIWLIPAAVVSVTALAAGRLDWRWAIPVVLAAAAWCWDLAHLRAWAHRAGPAFAAVREFKFAAIAVFFAASVIAGRSRPAALRGPPGLPDRPAPGGAE